METATNVSTFGSLDGASVVGIPKFTLKQYAKLLALWSNADAQLTPALADVQGRYARLRSEPAPP